MVIKATNVISLWAIHYLLLLGLVLWYKTEMYEMLQLLNNIKKDIGITVFNQVQVFHVKYSVEYWVRAIHCIKKQKNGKNGSAHYTQ